MLDNAWPSLIWHLYDYFLKPGGGYFGAKKACEPLHIQYSYNDRAVAIVNSTARSFHQLRARASVLNLDMTERHAQQILVDVPDDGSVVAFVLPEIANLDTTYFVDLTLEDSSGAVIDRNLYWLSTQPDVLDKAGSTFSVTPTVAFADLTGIARLPSVPLQAQATRRREGEDEVVSVTLANPGAALAFFVRLEVTRGLDGEEVLPIRYDDNDVSLRPGEARPLTARYRATDLDHSAPAIRLTGWNVPPVSLAVP
jgi:exo-1,4-beta-D-glucosaminidase